MIARAIVGATLLVIGAHLAAYLFHVPPAEVGRLVGFVVGIGLPVVLVLTYAVALDERRRRR